MSVIAFLICCLPVAQANEAPRDKQPPVALANKAFQGEGLRSLAWDARSKITSLDYRIKTHYEWLARNMSSDLLIHVKKQDANVFYEIGRLKSAEAKEIRSRTVFIRNKSEKIRHSSVAIIPNEVTTNITSNTFKDSQEKHQRHIDESFDIRAIGIFPGETLNTGFWSFPDFLMPPRNSIAGETVEPVTFNGEKCMKVTIELKGLEGIRRFWIAPDLDYAVLRCEFDVKKNENFHFQGIIETVGGFHGKPRVWFPTRYRVEIFEEMKKTRVETSEVEVISLNKPIDDEAFSLKALNLPKGTNVYVVPSNRRSVMIWDGEGLSPPALKN